MRKFRGTTAIDIIAKARILEVARHVDILIAIK